MNKDLGSIIQVAAYTSAAEIDTQYAESMGLALPTESGTAVAVTECDTSGGTYTDVGEAFILVGDDDGVLSGNDVTYSETGTGLISYVGKKRYVKFTVTNAVSNTSLILIKGSLSKAPTLS
jgi:hypothetical protein